MIYIKRILWLLGYPIMWLLSCILLMMAFIFMCFIAMFLYIKNGNIQGYDNCIDQCFKLIDWYSNIELKNWIMKGFITTILLCGAISLTSLGLIEHNVIIAMIGGLFCGIYNASINEKKIWIMKAYITKDKFGLVQLWNNKPEYNNEMGCWQAWIKEGYYNEIAIDVTANNLFREMVTFESSPKSIE